MGLFKSRVPATHDDSHHSRALIKMKLSLPPKPKSLHYATLSMMGGLVLEIIGIAAHSVTHGYGWSGVVFAHILMVATAIGALLYIFELESGRLRSMAYLVFGMLIQVVLIFVVFISGYMNGFFMTAMILDFIGTLLLFYPDTSQWYQQVKYSRADYTVE